MNYTLRLQFSTSFYFTDLVWSTAQFQFSNTSDLGANTLVDIYLKSKPSLCLHDVIRLTWKSKVNPAHFSFLVQSHNRITPLSGFLHPTSLIESCDGCNDYSSWSKANRMFYIECLVNELHCKPAITSVSLKIDEPKLIITFNTKTNEPPLLSSSEISRALDINPLIVGEAKGKWISSEQLEIQISAVYQDRIMQSYNISKAVDVSLREPPPQPANTMYFGEEIIQPSEHGKLTISAVNTSSRELLSQTLSVDVSPCNVSVLPPTLSRLDNSVEEKKMPNKFIQYSGILSISGKSAVEFPHRTVPALETGTWSLSMWLKCVEGPSGSFRTLFFKGDGRSGQRTPSAWFLPHTNRLAIRASTPSNLDLGADTTIEIPMNSWTLLAFSFQNISTNSNNNGNYIISVYVDGVLDVALTFTGGAIANDGPLQLFKDVSHNGRGMFVQELVIWDGVLDLKDVKAIYSSGRNRFVSESVDLSLAVLRLSNFGPIIPESNQAASCSGWSSGSTSGVESDRESTRWMWGTISPHLESTVRLQRTLSEAASQSMANCDDPESRLDRYAEAAWFGSAESLRSWAMLVLFGSERPDNSCGFETQKGGGQGGYGEGEESMRAAVYALVRALEMGDAGAAVPLATVLFSGAGIAGLLLDEETAGFFAYEQDGDNVTRVRSTVPLPPSAGPSRLHKAIRRLLIAALHTWASDSEVVTSDGRDLLLGTNALFPVVPTESLRDGETAYLTSETIEIWLSPDSLYSNRMNRSSANSSEEITVLRDAAVRVGQHVVTNLALGLLHVAAMRDVSEAQAVLQYRYWKGLGVLQDAETAAFYAAKASVEASRAFHTVGGRPVLEGDRIDSKTELVIDQGRRGDGDEHVQLLLVQAEEGHVPSMVAAGQMYQFGTRGVARDLPRALQLFTNAAALGDTSAQCSMAAMLLKGEGAERNTSRAVSLFEEAAAKGALTAINGLGYVYFFGQGGMQKNETKAFHYFMEGARTESDADSLFNAGYCLEHGQGVTMDKVQAANLYEIAARKFGNFDSVLALGHMYSKGEGVSRSPSTAMNYFSAANGIGPWSGWLRRGLDQYLLGNYQQSVLCYVMGGELGYEISQGNAAYILFNKITARERSRLAVDASPALLSLEPSLSLPTATLRRLESSLISSGDRLLLRQLALSAYSGNAESAHSIGTLYYSGRGVEQNCEAALWWLSKASHQGFALSSAYIGAIHHFGLCGSRNGNAPRRRNLARARRYYEDALSSRKTHALDSFASTVVSTLHTAIVYRGYSALFPAIYLLETLMRWSFYVN